MTSISKVSSRSRAILSVVPMCLARWKRRSHIASDAGVAKTILATFAINGKRAAFYFHQLSTLRDRPSELVTSSFIHPSMQALHHEQDYHHMHLEHEVWEWVRSTRTQSKFRIQHSKPRMESFIMSDADWKIHFQNDINYKDNILLLLTLALHLPYNW